MTALSVVLLGLTAVWLFRPTSTREGESSDLWLALKGLALFWGLFLLLAALGLFSAIALLLWLASAHPL